MSNGGLLQKALEQKESQVNADGSNNLMDNIARREGVVGEIPNAAGESNSSCRSYRQSGGETAPRPNEGRGKGDRRARY